MSVGYALCDGPYVEATGECSVIAGIFCPRSLQPESKYPNQRCGMATETGSFVTKTGSTVCQVGLD